MSGISARRLLHAPFVLVELALAERGGGAGQAGEEDEAPAAAGATTAEDRHRAMVEPDDGRLRTLPRPPSPRHAAADPQPVGRGLGPTVGIARLRGTGHDER